MPLNNKALPLLYCFALLLVTPIGVCDPLGIELSALSLHSEANEMPMAIENITPGEPFLYQVKYQNSTGAVLTSVNAILPVPENTILVEVLNRENLSASVDQTHYEKWPLTEEVKTESGKIEKRLRPLSDVRSLQWYIPQLFAHQEMRFTAVVVIPNQ